MADSGGDWRNWCGSVSARPGEVVIAADVDQVREVCARAYAGGQKVKPIGAGHSFSAIGQPVDIQVRLDGLSGVRSVTPETGRVWFGAGTPLARAALDLHHLGLALPNQGDYDNQTLAGAVTTGTHGTGARLTGFAGMVRGVELVLADGSLLRVTEDENAEMLPAAAVSLGALGVVTAIEFACVPAYLLTSVEQQLRLADVLVRLDEIVETTDHFEFFWFPQTTRVLAKSNQRHSDLDRRAPMPAWRRRLDDDWLSNGVFRAVNELTTRVPQLTRPLNRVSALALSRRESTDWSHVVFPTRRDVRFIESEYAIPRAAVVPVLRELDRWLRWHPTITSFPLEVRFAAADDRWMSTAYERESGYIAVHQFHKRGYREYFEAFWAIVAEHDGRPHWGKLHDLGADQLRELYPRFDDFVALRNSLDPTRVFGNDHLDSVIGP